jgi:hypothetical protein
MTPEMRAFEYALGLFSVLIGLAIADIATSFHRLVRSRAVVTWDPLALLAALYALLIAIGMWFDLWGVRNVAAARHFFFYLLMVALLFMVFLIAAASLPDDPGGGCNLSEFYSRNRRYFWALIALFQLVYLLLGIYFAGALLSRAPPYYRLAFAAQMSILFLVPVALGIFSSRVLHYSGLALLFATTAWHYAPYSIN